MAKQRVPIKFRKASRKDHDSFVTVNMSEVIDSGLLYYTTSDWAKGDVFCLTLHGKGRKFDTIFTVNRVVAGKALTARTNNFPGWLKKSPKVGKPIEVAASATAE